MRKFGLSASFTSSGGCPIDTRKLNASFSDDEIEEYDKIIQEIKDGGGVFGSMGVRQHVMMRLKRKDSIPMGNAAPKRNGLSKRLGGALSRSFQSAFSGREREESSESTMMIMPGRRQSLQPELSNILYQSQKTKMVIRDIEFSDSEDKGEFLNNESEANSHHRAHLRMKSLLAVTEEPPPTGRSKGNRRRLTRDSLGFDSFASCRAGSLICGFREQSRRTGSLICGFRNSSKCSARSLSLVVDEKEDELICDWASRRRSSFSSLASGVLGREQIIQGSLTKTHSISSLTCDWDGLDLIRARAA